MNIPHWIHLPILLFYVCFSKSSAWIHGGKVNSTVTLVDEETFAVGNLRGIRLSKGPTAIATPLAGFWRLGSPPPGAAPLHGVTTTSSTSLSFNMWQLHCAQLLILAIRSVPTRISNGLSNGHFDGSSPLLWRCASSCGGHCLGEYHVSNLGKSDVNLSAGQLVPLQCF